MFSCNIKCIISVLFDLQKIKGDDYGYV